MRGYRKILWAAAGVAALFSGAAMAADAQADKADAREAAPGPELTGVDRLLAMEEIKNARLTFCRALDAHDWPALRSVITDDFKQYFAQTDGPGGPNVRPPIVTTGGDVYVDFVKKFLTGHSIHICTMPQFEYITKDRAKALWFINGYGDIGDMPGLGYERLIEHYVKVNGKWLAQSVDARVEALVKFPKEQK
ncbi:MAG: nuclear transport factor 2 family protein [Sphingobium sp.]